MLCYDICDCLNVLKFIPRLDKTNKTKERTTTTTCVCIEDFVVAVIRLSVRLSFMLYPSKRWIDSNLTLVNVNTPVVATTSWLLHFTAPVVA